MKLPHWLLCILTAGHLTIVTCSAFGCQLTRCHWLSNAIRAYGDFSGARTNYGFFAPEIGPQQRARFVLTDADGRSWSDDLESEVTNETNLRFAGVGYLVGALNGDIRDALFRSLAAMMFGRHPNATRITVYGEVFGIRRADGKFDLPAMDEAREGRIPCWVAVHEYTFSRNEMQLASLVGDAK